MTTFTFLQRDAALRDQPKKFCDALIASNRFWRDERGLIWFKVGEGDLVRIEHRGSLREILLSGEVIELAGDLDDNAYATLWLWFTSRSWTFPRLNPDKPWHPARPAPVSRTGHAFVRPGRS
jgi:hypothetical protein